MHNANITDEKYEFPGGRIEFGETIEETLIREMKEEVNLDVTPVKLIDTWNYINNDQTLQVAGIIYLCKADNLDCLQISDEHTDYQWFDIGDISQMNILFDHRMENWNWDEILGSL